LQYGLTFDQFEFVHFSAPLPDGEHRLQSAIKAVWLGPRCDGLLNLRDRHGGCMAFMVITVMRW
ncbi:hypothetical protein, partial [Escherichia coli]|uniref:hypothetical protein n=1 Tax=Escherichia coli TaxID=562 RepID=UPI001C704F1C